MHHGLSPAATLFPPTHEDELTRRNRDYEAQNKRLREEIAAWKEEREKSSKEREHRSKNKIQGTPISSTF